MASDEERVTVSWTPNTEPDLATYIIQIGLMEVAGFVGLRSDTLTVAEAVSAGHTLTYTPKLGGFSASFIPTDGVWYFRMFARDSSGNTSDPTSVQSKRIIRTSNRIKLRK